MNEAKRRFFSGDTLQQALVQAANHFGIDPESIAYRSLDKKHGFLRTRKKVVIEVDPDAPRRLGPPSAPARVAPPPPAEPAPAHRPADTADTAETMDTAEAAAPAAPVAASVAPRPERGDDRGNRRGPGGDRRPPGRGDRSDRGARGGGRERRDDRGNRAPRENRERREPRIGPRYERSQPDNASGGLLRAQGGELVALPEMPRRPSERYPEATGPQATAALHATELLLRIAGLELTPRVLQGDDRLEIDLSGEDVDWCFADDGELVMAIEHLLPRMIRSLSGESVLCRVDCDNFQEIREERLRSLAQQMAEEVRRKGRPRTLEPMNPADRRIVHMTLADDPGVATESLGDGYFKRVTIRPA
jgi:spoIIIJ-associated protein